MQADDMKFPIKSIANKLDKLVFASGREVYLLEGDVLVLDNIKIIIQY